MREVDLLTLLSLAEHEPKTWVSVRFQGASFFNSAHASCVVKQTADSPIEVSEVWLIETNDLLTDRMTHCYYCELKHQMYKQLKSF